MIHSLNYYTGLVIIYRLYHLRLRNPRAVAWHSAHRVGRSRPYRLVLVLVVVLVMVMELVRVRQEHSERHSVRRRCRSPRSDGSGTSARRQRRDVRRNAVHLALTGACNTPG